MRQREKREDEALSASDILQDIERQRIAKDAEDIDEMMLAIDKKRQRKEDEMMSATRKPQNKKEDIDEMIAEIERKKKRDEEAEPRQRKENEMMSAIGKLQNIERRRATKAAKK